MEGYLFWHGVLAWAIYVNRYTMQYVRKNAYSLWLSDKRWLPRTICLSSCNKGESEDASKTIHGSLELTFPFLNWLIEGDGSRSLIPRKPNQQRLQSIQWGPEGLRYSHLGRGSNLDSSHVLPDPLRMLSFALCPGGTAESARWTLRAPQIGRFGIWQIFALGNSGQCLYCNCQYMYILGMTRKTLHTYTL